MIVKSLYFPTLMFFVCSEVISAHELSHLVQLLANCQASAHTDRAAGSDVTKLFHVQPQLSARNRLLLVNVWLRAACSHGNGILQQSWLERLQALQLKVEEVIQKEDGSDEGSDHSDALERNDVKTNTTQTARPHVKSMIVVMALPAVCAADT